MGSRKSANGRHAKKRLHCAVGADRPVTEGSHIIAILGLRGGVAAIFSIAVSAARAVAGYMNSSAELRYGAFVGRATDRSAFLFGEAVASRRVPRSRAAP